MMFHALRVDAVTGQLVERTVVSVSIDTPNSGLTGISQSRRILIAKEPEQTKHYVTH